MALKKTRDKRTLTHTRTHTQPISELTIKWLLNNVHLIIVIIIAINS